jgi:hypothetical protein
MNLQNYIYTFMHAPHLWENGEIRNNRHHPFALDCLLLGFAIGRVLLFMGLWNWVLQHK